MLTSCHTIVRLGVLAFAGVSLAALTVEQLQPTSVVDIVGPNVWEAVTIEDQNGASVLELLHRQDGTTLRAMVPSSERWEFFSTSPWLQANGSMEAIGRYSSMFGKNKPDGEGSVGLIRVRLPEGKVLERIDLSMLPTGRPAWNPQRSDQVVFPGSTGLLYSYRFAPEAEERPTLREASVEAVTWRCEAPGAGEPQLLDPVWLQEPEMRNLMIVSLAVVGRTPFGEHLPITPWWLELTEEGNEIIDAGPLFDPSDATSTARVRSPIVTTQDGRTRLIYIEQAPDASVVVCAADLEWDPATNRPRVRPGSSVPVPCPTKRNGTLVPSLNAESAFFVRPVSPWAPAGVFRIPLDSSASLPDLDLAAAVR